jgi:hypothetical protein
MNGNVRSVGSGVRLKNEHRSVQERVMPAGSNPDWVWCPKRKGFFRKRNR